MAVAATTARHARAARHGFVSRLGKVRAFPAVATALTVSVLTALTVVVFVAPAQAADPCSLGQVIACENTKTGSPASEWDTTGSGDPTIAGFATATSVNVGGAISFKIQTDARAYTIDIYRMGYYQGLGARKIASITPSATLPQTQPNCLTDATTGLIDCGNWATSASWTVPSTAVSGLYFLHLTRTDNGGDSHIPFVVRNDASHSDILFQASDETWQAYNTWGGNSLYTGDPAGRAYKVSFNRPYNTRGTPAGQDYFFANEYPQIRFLEANGYDVSYQSGLDVDRYGSLLLNHKTYMSVGHDEYWSAAQRTNVEAARDAGVNLAFFSANEVYWKTRFETSIDGSDTPYRTMVSYKETYTETKIDPTSTWTGTWRDPSLSPPGDGGRPENSLTGQLWTINCCSESIKVPAADGKMRFWRNTAIGNQAAGATAVLPMNTLGYEWDEDVDNGFRPAGQIRLSTATYTEPQKLSDHGVRVASGTATHHLTMYRASSGALVFGAGTVQWAWGLDANHDGPTTATDPSMRQATVNVLADMKAQPATIQSDLTLATASTDTTAPTATITSPAAGATIANGSTVTISGTAADSGGGVVGGVEVSTDGGTTWHPADGRSAWTYTWKVTGLGVVDLKVRATDDSLNTQSTPATRSVTVACPCSMFNTSDPAVPSANDTGSIEVGTRFKTTQDGWITGVRFYKGPANTGQHTGTLWSNDGTQLATGTFVGESASGWQTLQFPTAVRVTAGTSYVASYHAPNGGYSSGAPGYEQRLDDQSVQLADVSQPPLVATKTTTANPNGLYRYSSSATFPTSTFQGEIYFVSPVFDTVQPPDTTPPVVQSVKPTTGATSIKTTVTPSLTFSEPIKAGTLTLSLSSTAGQVAGTTTLSADRTVATFTPSAPLANSTPYTLTTNSGTDDAGNVLATYTTGFKTAASSTAGVCPCSIWADDYEPTTLDDNDRSSAELGVKFKADTAGWVSGIRFYKADTNVGTHTGTLWSSDGTQLATATFTNESTSGWQEVRFSTRVAVTPGTTYVASYHTAGHYSLTSGALTAAVVNSPLTALATGDDGPNGVYKYGAGTVFPTVAAPGTSYAVDVVFELPPDTTPPAVASTSPASSATSVRVSTVPMATFGEALSVAPTATMKAGATTVPVTVALDSGKRKVTITPTGGLQPDTQYTVTVSGAKDIAGNAMTADYSWTFTTSGTASCPCTLYPSDYTPTVTSTSDSSTYELGLRFTPAANGYVTGMRFYKGAGNTGTHTGTLWSSTGGLITTATFTTETASGWQQLAFAAPVAVSAGTTYVVSYSDPNGHYASDDGQLTNAYVNGPLTAPASAAGAGNGVYAGTTGRFPTNVFNNTAYGVDVVFSTSGANDQVPPGLLSSNPVSGQTSVPTTQALVATFNEPLAASSVQATMTGAGGASVPVTVAVGSDSSVTVTPTAALANATTYTVRISASDLAGNAMTSPVVISFTTAKTATTTCPCSLFTDDQSPAVASESDTRQIELGVKFTSASNGYITGLSFYKGSSNTGTHVGTLWSSTGAELATATFKNESAAGWQQVSFTNPVAVTAGTQYVASYHANNGGYSETDNAFATAATTRGPLTAPIGSATDPNGVYGFGARAFPTSGDTANYWVDVTFDTVLPPDTVPPTVSSVTPADTTTNVSTSATTSATFSEAVTPGTVQMTLKSAAGTTVAGSTSYNATTQTATFTPSAALATSTVYTATATASDIAGNAMTAPRSWSFTTMANCPCTLFSASSAPAGAPDADTKSTELGVRFTAATSGYVTGVRFYKGNTNTGTHTGSLWSSTGTRLATGTFTGETASGWQTLTFPTAVQVTAGTVYTASYLAPAGHYSADSNFFATDYNNGPLTAPTAGGNGVYIYGTGGVAPTLNGNRTNYWVDPVFQFTPPPADSTPPVITQVAANGSGTGSTVTWLTDEPSSSTVQYGTSATALSSPASGTDGVTTHTVSLAGLTPGTQYYYRVTSLDAAGNSATSPAASSPAATFTMPGGTSGDLALSAARTFSSSVESTPWGSAKAVDGVLTSTSTSAGWSSSNTLTANHTEYFQVDLGSSRPVNQVTLWPRTDTGNVGQGFPVNFTVATSTDGTTFTTAATVTGAAVPTGAQTVTFTAATGRYVRITGTSLRPIPNDGNQYRMQFAEVGVYGPPPDTTAPQVTAVAAGGTGTTATVTWTTDEASSSVVQYGTSATSLTSTVTGTGGVTAHSVSLPGLTAGTPYYYRVVSADAAGNSTTSPATTQAAATFTIAIPPDTTAPVITAVAANGTLTTATVTWTTDENSSSTVQYGTSATALTSTVSGAGGVKAHSVTLSGLTAGTPYFYRVVSADAAGNTATSPAAPAAPATFTISTDTTPPTVTAVAATGSGTTASVTWTTNETSTSVVQFGTTATSLTSTASTAGNVTAHSVSLTGLTQNTRYYYRVTSVDPAGNSTTSPAAAAAPAQYAPTVTPLSYTTTADFNTGTNSSTYVGSRSAGEVVLTPSGAVQEFDGTTSPPTGWTSTSLATGSAVTLAAGLATVSGRFFRTTSTFTYQRELDAVLTMKAVNNQWWGETSGDYTSATTSWAAFHTTSTGGLVAESHIGNIFGLTNATYRTTTTLSSSALGGAHRFEIDNSGTTITYSIDGTVVATHAKAITTSMYIAARDATVDANPMVLDSAWLSPYASTGTWTSPVVDAGASVKWGAFTPTATAPTGTTITYQYRSAATTTALTSATWTTIAAGATLPPTNRYFQFRANLTTGASGSAAARTSSPTLSGVTIGYSVV